MRVAFAGTPEPALPSLRALLESDHEVVAVISRPDAPSGRGRRLTPSPVAQLAIDHGLELLQPPSPKDPGFLARLTQLAPDACPIVAYGELVPTQALSIPRFGWINLHFSLLPAWRGAAPVQHAIWHGDQISGASTFLLDQGLDTGPVFGVVTQQIGPRETAGSLLAELADAGAHLLVKTLDGIEKNELMPAIQPTDDVSLAPKITVEMARVDWSLPALAIDRMVRACTPAPGAWCEFNGARMKLAPLLPTTDPQAPALQPGELAVSKRSVLVGTPTGGLELSTVQPQGRAMMAASDWARGTRVESGAFLS
ncbi:MAG: methionyl-tRNA formyltransferase [Candidatus Nanopelagicales bacterium]